MEGKKGRTIESKGPKHPEAKESEQTNKKEDKTLEKRSMAHKDRSPQNKNRNALNTE